jgi:Putative Actinobacterial Holin-X, holin superfamily III
MDQPESTEALSPPSEDQSVPELVGELATEVATLVKQELALAAAEMEGKARDAATNLGRMVVGGALGVVSVLVLTGALVLALASVLPLWASAGTIAVVLGGSGYAIFRRGCSELRAISIMPTETFASLQDDRLWAKEQIESTRDQMTATLSEVRSRLKPPKPAPKKRAPAKRKRPPA